MKEREILMRWALRFDGHKYREETGLDPIGFADQYFARWSLEGAAPLDCLAAFYLLQRFLYKWGGDYLADDDRHWRLFRELFLHTARMEVPERYRGGDDWNGDCYRDWDLNFRGRLEEHLDVVRRVHKAIRYSTEEESIHPGLLAKSSAQTEQSPGLDSSEMQGEQPVPSVPSTPIEAEGRSSSSVPPIRSGETTDSARIEFVSIDDGDFIAARRLPHGSWHIKGGGGKWQESDLYVIDQLFSGWADRLTAVQVESLLNELGGEALEDLPE